MRNIFIFFLVLLLPVFSIAQNYGNEWINNQQQYFKVKIAREGIYRIDYTALTTAIFQSNSGMDLSVIDPRKIQLFQNGVEIPVFLRGENDGIFNFDDYIEFYATANNGKMDRALFYSNPLNDPLHDYESLFADTSAVFITFLPNSSPQNGKRMQVIRNHTLNTHPILPYFTKKTTSVFSETYYQGHPFIVANTALYYPEYTEGEGWLGNRYGVVNVSTPLFRTSTLNMLGNVSGFNPRLTFKTLATSQNLNFPFDHHLQLSLGNNGTLFTPYFDTMTTGFGVVSKSLEFPISLLQGSNQLFVKQEALSIANIPFQTFNPSFIEVEFPASFDFFNDNNLKGSIAPNNGLSQINITNFGFGSFQNPLVYDLVNGRRYTPSLTSSQNYSLVANASAIEWDFYAIDSSLITNISAIEYVVMPNFTSLLNNSQYIIITHKALAGKETEDYLNYRKTTYASQLFVVEDLYDAFSYGVRHPLAVRRLCDYLLTNSNTLKPEFLFFIGRGTQSNLQKNPNFKSLNKLPILGVPASDVLYTAGLNGEPIISPALSTGRLTADSKSDIAIYLSKIIKQEQSPNAYWKKNIMHLGGGNDGNESRIIRSYLDYLETFPESEPFGGEVKGFFRVGSSASADLDIKANSIKAINNGLSLITFLGHGSTSVLDIDIGDTSDYLNDAKFPVMYFNGCQVGNPALGFNNGNLFFGERMLRASNKGGIVFMGQSALSELGTVGGQMQRFYMNMFQSNVGKPVGFIHKETLKQSLDYNNPLSRYHNTVLFFQGDPAFKISNPSLPDYFVDNSSVFISPSNVNSLSDSFNLGIIVKNAGRYIPEDFFFIRVKRVWPNNSNTQDTLFKVPSLSFNDTFYLTYKTKDLATTGLNVFEVWLNPDRTVLESDYANNYVRFDRNIEGNGISLLYPSPFGIHNKADTVELIAQSLNLLKENNQFIFEIDTNPKFNSPWVKRTVPALNAGNLVSWKVPILPTDSTVYYWRARLNLPTEQGGFWEDRSFIYIKDGSTGWSQSHHPQFYKSSDLNGITLDTLKREFEFQRTERSIWVDTRINSHANLGVKFAGYASQDVNPGAGGSFIAVLFDKNTLELMLHPNHYPKCWRGATYPPFQAERDKAYYCFGNTASDLNDFEALVNDLPEGTHMAFFTRYESNISTWSETLKGVLRRFGAKAFEGYSLNQTAYVMVGTLGSDSAAEHMSHINSSTQGYAAVEGRILGRIDRGSLQTSLIGPAEKWGNTFFDFRHTTEIPNADEINYSIIGIDTNKNEVVLYSNLTAASQDISLIDAENYRYLKLVSNFKDEVDRSASLLRHWMVTFDELPEGTVNTGNNYVFYKDTIQEGDSIRVNIAFQNISPKAMDSVFYTYVVMNLSNQSILYQGQGTGNSIAKGEAVFLNNSFPSIGLSGHYSLNIAFNPEMKQPEVSLSNNYINIPFFVRNDKLNPLLDVTFDGKHIVNGEIVSPSPRILITSKDENKFLLQTDTSAFDISFKRPGSLNFEKIDNFSNDLVFRPATNSSNMASIEYKPNDLPDGKYTLRVQSRDMSGNNSGKDFYSIDFQVINQNSITNFYPYPNPFTTQMKFVFTMTGKQIPEDIRIKIFTISGKVVREINKEELGPIRVGNNISEFTWDGTDQYGDRLANGVYLYQVRIIHSGEEFIHRESAGDASFNKNMGKIYLMR